jgi:uncharacterized RDD family membrane protein YckC
MQLHRDTEFLSAYQFQIDKPIHEQEDRRPMQKPVPQPGVQFASAKRRLLSMIYDGLLLAAVLFIAMAIFIPIAESAGIERGHPLFKVYFLLVCFLFYAGFWTHGGQTLGMKTWKIKLVHENGQPISWGQALLRYMTALPAWLVILVGATTLLLDSPLQLPKTINWINRLPDGLLLGIGLLMLYFDQRPNNWRDRFSHTQIIQISYSSNAS